MIVGGQTEARAQLPSTIIDYHEPFEQGFKTLNECLHQGKIVLHVIQLRLPHLNFIIKKLGPLIGN